MKKFVLLCLTFVLVLPGIHLFAAHAAEKTLSGKDFVRIGKPGTVSGSLLEKDDEWYLKTKNGVYDLHFGNHEYRAQTGIKLQTGKNATVQGFIYNKDVAVGTITIDHKNYQFRRTDGSPLWAGSGKNLNRG
jgi:hypothetical protein